MLTERLAVGFLPGVSGQHDEPRSGTAWISDASSVFLSSVCEHVDLHASPTLKSRQACLAADAPQSG